jgi:Zn-dependent protease/predicted transcriptional regulator
MRPSIRLGRVAGVQVGANWSVLVIVALLAFGLYGTVLPAAAPGLPPAAYAFAGAVTSVLFLACLLAHELAHALVARYHGVEVRRITLWLLGGVSELETEPPSPRAELLISGAGPLSSLLLAVVGALATVLAGALGLGDLVVVSLAWLAAVNAVLAVFNLLPGAPLDGGRILHAVLWRRRGDRISAQVSADRAGVVVGIALGSGGLAQMLFAGDISGLWLVLLGWFLVSAANAESATVQAKAALAGLTVRDIMTPDPVCVLAGLPVDAFVTTSAAAARHRAFPVVDLDGTVVGVVQLARLAAVPPAMRTVRRIGEVATPIGPTAVLSPDDPASAVARVLTAATPVVPVVEAGHVVGIVGAVDLARAVDLMRLKNSRAVGE